MGAISTTPTRYDAIILDRSMPNMDGMEFLRRVKKTPALAELPVIMQTAICTPDKITEGLLAGAYYYLTKPYEPAHLISIVRAAISDSRTHTLSQRLATQPISRLSASSSRFLIQRVEQVGDLADRIALFAANPDNVAMGLRELLCNAIEHGNLKISYADKTRSKLDGTWESLVQSRASLAENQDKTVRVNLHQTSTAITLDIEDDGDGFDWQNYLEISPERACDPNGRGIALARMLSFSSLQYLGRGNRVRVAFETNPVRRAVSA